MAVMWPFKRKPEPTFAELVQEFMLPNGRPSLTHWVGGGPKCRQQLRFWREMEALTAAGWKLQRIR